MACKGPNRWICAHSPSGDIEWASAFFKGLAFSPHRHDTYAIGCTTAGVQSFNYRGERRISCSGDVFILHPDELHDGCAGTDEGYGYRIVYIDPCLILDALGGSALPFVSDAVRRDPGMTQAVASLFPDLNETEDTLYLAGAVTELADTLRKLSGQSSFAGIDITGMKQIRNHLLDIAPASVSIETLEREFGIDRFSLSRQFRKAFGVSPHRFVTLRRLDIAKLNIQHGSSLAHAAFKAGFADQSHMTRQFRKAFGLSPGVWRSMLRDQ